jgi:peptidylprolyl isomerase
MGRLQRATWPALLALAAACASAAPRPAPQAPAAAQTLDEVLAASKPSDWRELDPERTLYLELSSGVVVIELAPEFAPRHVENIKRLVRERFFDGLTIMRSQDNFVVQWGDASGNKSTGSARRTLAAEFTRPLADLAFHPLPDPDTYAAEVGFVAGFPAARDPQLGLAWAVHCYGTIGAGRDLDADSGGGTELYAVTGHAPRQLDRNVSVVGRVVRGMELLSVLPRGRAAMGFYEQPAEHTSILRVRLAADVAPEERIALELLRTDTPTFDAWVEARRNRRDAWYKAPAGRIDVCNVPLPVRPL